MKISEIIGNAGHKTRCHILYDTFEHFEFTV